MDAKKHWTRRERRAGQRRQRPVATTDRDYGDIELLIDYKTVAKADSGIYLRGTPQVQIWDYDQGRRQVGPRRRQGLRRPVEQHARRRRQGPAGPGRQAVRRVEQLSHPPGRRADTVYLNGKLVVDDARMENFWDRKRPLPEGGPDPAPDARRRDPLAQRLRPRDPRRRGERADLRRAREAGFETVFNGKDFTGWAGPVENYEVKDGAIVCKPKKGGTIYTKESYGDFVARLEYKLPPAATTAWRSATPAQGDTAYVGMCELQVLDDDAPEVRQARPAPVQRLGLRHGRRPSRLPAAGRRVELQEVTVHGLDDQGGAERHAHPRRRPEQGDGVHGRQGTPRQGPHVGPLRLRGHGDPVAFRNVRIKRL